MELWASPYSADPSALVPFKVGDFPSMAGELLLGANGRVAAAITDTSTGVWDLATNARTVQNLPSGLGIDAYLGMTSDYVWVAAGPGGVKTNVISSYLRFALP